MPISTPTPSNLFQGANQIEVRGGTTAQSLVVYRTYTDSNNFSGMIIYFDTSSSTMRMAPTYAGTGTSYGLVLSGGPSNNLYFTGGAGGAVQWGVTTAGNFYPVNDNTYDFGNAGARVKNIYAAGFVKTGSKTVASLTAAATAGSGARDFVTDATATTFLSVVAGGGANKVPVVCDGTNWLIG